ncbi:MAG: PQQ-binding-like beta-propeller repeat protein, partial [Pseudomonadota bacterium]
MKFASRNSIFALLAGAFLSLPAIADNYGYSPMGPPESNWATGGEDRANTRNNGKVRLAPEDVEKIMQKWSYKFRGDPWTQPTVAWGKVFMGDNKGWIYALDAKSGKLIWEKELKSYWDRPGRRNPTNDANDPNDPDNLFPNPKPDIAATRSALAARYSRVHGRTLIFGDQAGNPTLVNEDGTTVPFNGANIYLVDADNGRLLRMTKVAQNDEPARNGDGLFPAQLATPADFTVLTGAMALAGNTVITGVAGLAEANPGCRPATDGGCTLRGRVLAFNADTLKLKWETYTTPAVKGFTGASVWQSTPAVDMRRGLVYVGTGDNYTTPYDTCYIEEVDKSSGDFYTIGEEFVKTCIKPYKERRKQWRRNFVDSILAINLKNGKIKWSHRTLLYDTWNLACLGGGTLPDGTPVNWVDHCGPDMDFSHHPMLCRSNYGPRSVLVVGQKTGQMRGLNPRNGKLIWETDNNFLSDFAPGLVGGFQWGAACTGNSIVGLAANSYGQDHTIADGSETTTGGSMVVFDSTTGNVKSETLPKTRDEVHPGLQSVAATIRGLGPIAEGGPPATIGAASCAGRICGWGTSGKHGSLLLTDTRTGETLWSKATANGSVLWGGAFVELPKHGKWWFVGAGYASFDTGVGSDGVHPNFWAYSFNPELLEDKGG